MKMFIWGLTLLFIGLKLTDHIVWSWWWVLSPLWLPLSVILAGILFLAVFSKTFRAGFRKSYKDHQAQSQWERLKKNLKYKDFEA
jgi:hypothetical protein